ncbi:hypothetical protein RchiOBHm_Chr2g0175021 [Rosa chinensis]|uniref:Uncharacterized protein n=1 Tax=Rosa chinensis TaxID=74649 RepID=A0A2P6S6C0_ROSCH|nr:hypothetical protein RchiOBHm_Chr2g0175021 [Rosa chinensis]
MQHLFSMQLRRAAGIVSSHIGRVLSCSGDWHGAIVSYFRPTHVAFWLSVSKSKFGVLRFTHGC